MVLEETDKIPAQLATQFQFFKKKREQTFAEVQKIYDISSNVAPGTVSSFLTRCNELSRLRDKFEVIQDKIIELNLQVDSSVWMEVDKVTSSFNELYYSIRVIEREVLGHRIPDALPKTEMSLPKIEVPVWDGDLETFHNFWSMFNTIVHDGRYSDVIKMSYLKRSLRDSPLKLIQNLSNDSYAEAYNLISNRYGNVRNLAAFYVDKMLNFPPLSGTSLKELQSFLDVFSTTCTAYNNLNIVDHNDFVLFQCAFRALPSQMRTLFERSLVSREDVPAFSELVEFVENQCKIEELSRRSNPTKTPVTGKTPSKQNRNPQSLLVTPETSEKVLEPPPSSPSSFSSNGSKSVCAFCGLSHSLYSCEKYNKTSINNKYEWLRKNNRCFRCLGTHNRLRCASKGKCSQCKSASHHSSLHRADPNNHNISRSLVGLSSDKNSKVSSNQFVENNTVNERSDAQATGSQTLLMGSSVNRANQVVLLGTAQALIRNKWGKFEPVRMVIDGGSQICLMTMECAQRLALPVFHKETNIDGALSSNLGTSKGVVSCTLSPNVNNPSVFLTTEAVVVRRVCADLPTVSLSPEVFNRFSHLTLADRSFCDTGRIDFLLGASLFTQIFNDDKCSIMHGKPAAFDTIFGWVIMGDVYDSPPPVHPPQMTLLTLESNLDRSLQCFWRSEEVYSPSQSLVDPLHRFAEDHFVATHSRRPDGSYQVRLPFEPDVEPAFSDTDVIARRRWNNLEKRLQKNSQLNSLYRSFMNEYRVLGHMTPALNPGNYYIPHFGIIKDSPTSPLRVVFDASCCDTSGKSLNDFLLAGPPLQKDIGELVTFFRLNPVALITDIKMMYRKIWIDPKDTPYQHIWYRENDDSDLIDFELQTLTYGLKSAPFLAQRTLKQLVLDEGDCYPLASRAILESCYMDDLCVSVSTENEAKQLKNELIALMSLGGFELRKWASNSATLLNEIPQEHQLPSLSLASREPSSLHVLGLQWEPIDDVFTYSVKSLGDAHTKREVLSRVASLYDPLGWVSPVIFKAKLFLREIWERSLDWDTPLPPDLNAQWREFSSEFSELGKIKIPRLITSLEMENFQIIGFCDASMRGYAAALYLRCYSNDESSVTVNLLCSKTRVAPLKVVTIPRLELNGALLLSQLLKANQPLISRLAIKDMMLFTDSTVVLGWINTPPHRLQTYVANRIVNILDCTDVAQWHHISTSLNVADVASRGLLPTEIVDNSSWWAGPNFLYNPVSTWPLDRLPQNTELPELKSKNVAMPVLTTPTPIFVSLIDRFSSLLKLKRVVAWMLRFIYNSRNRCKRKKGPLQPSELQDSLLLCVRATQRHYFSSELKALEKGKPLSLRMRRLTPFIHHGVIRVGGRLTHSLLPEAAKHPYLLPKVAHLSVLICDAYHQRLMHAGTQATQSLICQEFWIMSLRNLLRQRIHKCMICYRYKVKETHPLMADLPPSRITPCSPFARTAVDFAGPLMIKQSLRRNAPSVKVYMCVFVCMVTKAIHLELAGDLSSECFLGALNRFVARRGLCQEIFCDNGTNFHGAATELSQIFDVLNRSSQAISNHLAERNISFHFNPPESPWMGGLAEAAVKAAKRHFRHIFTSSLTFEEMTTVLAKVEAILNSRPLCLIGDSPESFFLSPAHFLIGRSLVSPLEHDLSSEPMTHLSRWQRVQQVSQLFWKRWSANYLHTLIERQKWTQNRPPLKEGDVVIVLRAQAKPLDWPLGRIVKLHVGADGVARSATVRTSGGTFKRPTAKLAPLPDIPDEPSD